MSLVSLVDSSASFSVYFILFSSTVSAWAVCAAHFRMILQKHRLFPVCIFSDKMDALGSLKRVTEMIFKISK
jgi:hypothetical protein